MGNKRGKNIVNKLFGTIASSIVSIVTYRGAVRKHRNTTL
jgi:hypothetical protein